MERTKQQKWQIALAFVFALGAALAFPLFFPSLHLTFFAPFLVIVTYKRSLCHTLVWALITGLIIDSLSGFQHLGVHSISYCATVAILYHQKQNFFEDRLTTLPVMTLFFGAITTVFQVVLLSLFDIKMKLSFGWFLTDICFYPLFDALYAYLWFTLPSFFMPKAPRHEYFMN